MTPTLDSRMNNMKTKVEEGYLFINNKYSIRETMFIIHPLLYACIVLKSIKHESNTKSIVLDMLDIWLTVHIVHCMI